MSARTKIILAVSLILNVFLIGIGLGVVLTGARIAPAQALKHPAPSIWLAAEVLPPADRAQFRQMLRDKAAEVQPELKSVRLARREAVALISQPNYDPTAVKQALRRAREGELHARSEVDAAYADYMARLTPQQRAAMAESMVRNRPSQLRAAMNGQPTDDPGKSGHP
jgi:uncharacterized membrane protein